MGKEDGQMGPSREGLGKQSGEKLRMSRGRQRIVQKGGRHQGTNKRQFPGLQLKMKVSGSNEGAQGARKKGQGKGGRGGAEGGREEGIP